MERLKQSLLIINYLTEMIRQRVDHVYYENALAIMKDNDPHDFLESITYSTFGKMIILDTCSFIEEYDKYWGIQTEELYREQIVVIKKICRPFINKIRKWSDLQVYRNRVVAHNFRDSNKHMMLLYEDLNTYNVPGTLLEFLVLRNCLVFTRSIIRQEFPDKYSEAIKELDELKFKESIPTEILSHNFHEINCNLIEESKGIAVSLKRSYSYEIDPNNP